MCVKMGLWFPSIWDTTLSPECCPLHVFIKKQFLQTYSISVQTTNSIWAKPAPKINVLHARKHTLKNETKSVEHRPI